MKAFIDRFSVQGPDNASISNLSEKIDTMQFSEVRAVKALSLEILMLLAVRRGPESRSKEKNERIMKQLEKYLGILDENDFGVVPGDLHPEIMQAAKVEASPNLPEADERGDQA